MLKLNTVMINSEQPDKLAAFYRDVLGEPGFEGNGYTGWKAGDAFLMIGPHSDVKGSSAEPARVITNYETTDVKGEFERLSAAGATVVAEPYHPGEDDRMTLATLADPDGNYLQLASPMPEGM